ncbi:HAD-IIA family hydrolase [Cohnella ginsengisoli]|uniref:HAD-IIA family hydrolase n=1 Tax=Cohnella ginsengisoli TaxID=425004 RepID=A0A9X4QLK3_9BACL|nr:HAD-IIA family hydrolase [Cohnella ginsengisoli]MDG0790535.1 HAD-IIA family hydrolase [Cohnella ginsengisoli]
MEFGRNWLIEVKHVRMLQTVTDGENPSVSVEAFSVSIFRGGLRMRNNTVLRDGGEIRAWLFDLDGTLYFGNKAAPGAREMLRRIRRLGYREAFVTNNSRHSAKEVAARLNRMGLEVSDLAIVTATEYSARFLKEKYGSLVVSVAGSPAFAEAHRLSGHTVRPLQDDTRPDAVVIGLDAAFTYRQLERIVHAVGSGAKLFASNPDGYHPGAGGRRVPETGALVAAIEVASGISASYIGKPEPYMFRYALSLCEVSASQAIMVGDNYDTDIRGGKGAGVRTVWLNGSTKPDAMNDRHAADRQAADIVVRHLPDLFTHIGGLLSEN